MKYRNDWDDDSDNDDIATKKMLNNMKYNHSLFKMLLIIGFLLASIIFLSIIFFKMGSQKRLPLNPTDKGYVLPPEERKLEKPLLGSTDDKTPLKPEDELSKIAFDFTPTSSNDIAKTPMLPDKVRHVIPKEVPNSSLELEDIWNNGNTASKKILANENSKKSATDYLPPWRRFSVPYKPTEGLPVFSVILEYNPKILNIDDLPTDGGYNVVIPGFLDFSESVLQALKQKNYEILLYLPMDDTSKSLSFKAISQESSFDSIRNSVAFHTTQLGGNGFVGFMNYGGKIVQTMLPKMNFMMSLFSKTGYLYIDNVYDNEDSLAFAAAEGQKVPSLRTKNYIHSVSTEFPRFIKQVQIEGTGIAIVKATPENVTALKEYEAALKNIKVRRIPVTGILKHQMLKAQNSF